MNKFVCILLIDEQKRFILQHRDDKDTIWNPNAWSTFGGGVDEGETPEQAIIRETKEELNYNLVNPIYLLDIMLGLGHIYFFYKHILNKEKEVFRLLEGDDWGWFMIDELNQLDWKHGAVLKDIIYDQFKTI